MTHEAAHACFQMVGCRRALRFEWRLATGADLGISDEPRDFLPPRSLLVHERFRLVQTLGDLALGGEVRIHPENNRVSGRHGVQYVAQCVACAALTLVVRQKHTKPSGRPGTTCGSEATGNVHPGYEGVA